MPYLLGFYPVGGWSVVGGIIVRRRGPLFRLRASIGSLLVVVVRLSLPRLRLRLLLWLRLWMILFTCRVDLRSGVLIFGWTWKESGWRQSRRQWVIFNWGVAMVCGAGLVSRHGKGCFIS